MTLKEKYLSYWNERNYQFQYHTSEFNKDTWDYKAVEDTANKLMGLAVGEVFKMGKNTFIIKAKNERYIVAATKSGKTYTIIDVVAGVCGPTDRVFQITDFTNEKDIQDVLLALSTGEWNLSYRHSVPVNTFITFNQ